MCILLEHAPATQTAQKQVLSLWVHLFATAFTGAAAAAAHQIAQAFVQMNTI